MLIVLRVAALLEAASLVGLLVNVVTVHAAVVTGLVGPLHGSAYLAVIGSTMLLPVPARVRLRALLPGIGGLLAMRSAARLDRVS